MPFPWLAAALPVEECPVEECPVVVLPAVLRAVLRAAARAQVSDLPLQAAERPLLLVATRKDAAAAVGVADQADRAAA